MSFITPCCGNPVQEFVSRAERATHTLASSTVVEAPNELPWLDDELRFDNGILQDCGNDGTKYADLIRSGNIPDVACIEISMFPADGSFGDILCRHKGTITSVTLDGFESTGHNGQPDYAGDMLWLVSILRELPHLSFLKIHGNEDSLFPKEFHQDLAKLTNLRSMCLKGSFRFGMSPLQCSSIKHLTIIEDCCTGDGCPVDLSLLIRLKTASICTRRKLILPLQNSSMHGLSVRNITSLQNVKFRKLAVLKMKNCPSRVVDQLLVATNPTSLRQLVIENKDHIQLHRGIDARKLNVLYLSNIALEYIDTSEETPVKSLSLINTTMMTTIVGRTLQAISAYVSCNKIGQVNMFYLNQNILERLGLGSEGRMVRDLIALHIYTMQVMQATQHPELSTFAPIKFPDMPRLKYLAIASNAELEAIGKMPELVELARSTFLRANTSRNGTENILQVASMVYCLDTFRYWASHNEYRPYEFLF